MASGKTTHQRNKTLDLWLGATVPTIPGTYYVALFTVAPNKDGGGTEVSGGSYARVAVTNNTTNWPNAASGRKTNATEIVFPQATANWGTIVAAALVSAASGAYTQYYWGLLSAPVAIINGQTRYFPIAAAEATEA
jgi:hypothetical protein